MDIMTCLRTTVQHFGTDGFRFWAAFVVASWAALFKTLGHSRNQAKLA